MPTAILLPSPTSTPVRPSSADFILRPTTSGLDARVVINGPNDGGPFLFDLAPDPRTSLVQRADGSIAVTRPVTTNGDNGNPLTIIQTEYIVQNPVVVDNNGDPTAVVETGPATMTLQPATSGRRSISLAIDHAWLNDPARVFPIHLDIPVVTAESAIRSGTFGTVNNCQPNKPASETDMIVGAENRCVYRGYAYFDVSSVPFDTAVGAATLWLYTRDQTGPTGVQIISNSIGSDDPSQSPSWNTVPLAAVSAPLSQSDSKGHWQSWDVTDLVRGWVNDRRTNGGITLTGTDTLVRFASAFGANTTGPSITPYLDISYKDVQGERTGIGANDTPGPMPGVYYDTAPTIYGFAQGSTPDFRQGNKVVLGPEASSAVPPCTPNGVTCGAGSLRLSMAAKMHASFIRLGIQLACPAYQKQGLDPNKPGPKWWGSDRKHPYHGLYLKGYNVQGTFTEVFDGGSLIDLLTAAQENNLIPIIEISANGYCNGPTAPSMWFNQVQDLIGYMYSAYNSENPPHLLHTSKMIYFEIGNEVNLAPFGNPRGGNVGAYTNGPNFSSQKGTYHYEDIFAAAARGLNRALVRYQFGRYRILTSGVIAPTSTLRPGMCEGQFNQGQPDPNDPMRKHPPYSSQSNYDFVFAAGAGINLATSTTLRGYGDPVDRMHLGLGVHPYGYDTSSKQQWQNFYNRYDASGKNEFGWAGPCLDLQGMFNTWQGTGSYQTTHPPKTQRDRDLLSRYYNTSYDFRFLPLVFSEINYSSGESYQYQRQIRDANGKLVYDPKTRLPMLETVTVPEDNEQAQGAYQADLFTWMYWHRCIQHVRGCEHDIKPDTFPIRVMIDRGVNGTDNRLGLYYGPSDSGVALPSHVTRANGVAKVVSLHYCPGAPGSVAIGKILSQSHTMASNFSLLTDAGCYTW